MSDSDGFLDFPNNDSNESKNLPSVKKNGSLDNKKDDKLDKIDMVDETSIDDLFDSSTDLAVPSNDETKVLTLSEDKVNNISTDVRKPDMSEDDKAEKSTPKKKNKVKKVLLWVGVSILGLIIGIVGFVIWYSNYLFSKIDFIEPEEINQTIVNEQGETKRISDLTEPTQNVYIEEETIHNYLLIGIDSRTRKYSEDGTGGLSDINMILSIDTKAGTIKLVSIARDSYVNIPGYKNPAKINSAMSRGGPELLKSTIEQNLRLTIDGYAYVNFYNMAAVIDAVGGVYVDVTKSELYSQNGLNDCLREVNQLYGYAGDYQQVNQTGHVWLNGRQAVAYSRIRYVGNGDYERSERQVEVLRSILDQFMAMSVTGKASAIDDVLSCISTNVSRDEITKYALEFLPSLSNFGLQYVQLPLEGCFNSGMYGGEWSIRPNWNAMIPVVQEFFYGERVEFDEVELVNHAPSLDSCPDDINLEEIIK